MKNVFLKLIKVAILGETMPLEISELKTAENLKSVFSLAKKHDLAHLVADALEKLNLLPIDDKLKTKFLKERNLAVYRNEINDYELERISVAFKGEKVPFIALKGSVIKNYYPEPWMRTSCDVDILVEPTKLDLATEILTNNLGYVVTSKGDHDVSFKTPSKAHIELHYKLFDSDAKKQEKALFENVFSLSKLTKNSATYYEMPNEYFYAYHISHIAKHLRFGGCGVRAILDTYVLNNCLTFDETLKANLLEKAGLTTLASNIENLSKAWFGNGEENDVTSRLSEYILTGGIYGTFETKIKAQQSKKSSKFSYLLSRIFLPYSQLKFKYPKLEKYPILYPYYIVKRWFSLLNKNKRELAVREYTNVTKTENSSQEEVKKLLDDLNI